MPLAEIAAIADGLEAIVVVDQVYLEFAIAAGHRDLDVLALTDGLDNVLVLRSLAKSHGLAGARIGYLVVPESLAERFDALRLPLSVGLATEELAVAALADPSAAEERWAAIMREQSRLADALRRLGCEVLDGAGNFVTFRPPDAVALADALLRRGLVLRALRRRDHGGLAAGHRPWGGRECAADRRAGRAPRLGGRHDLEAAEPGGLELVAGRAPRRRSGG